MRPARLFGVSAAVSSLAAAIIAVVQVATPIAHGWWLVAYLGLVGGVSQLLLGRGINALARRSNGRAPGRQESWAQVILWNSGTVLVAVGVVVDTAAGVLVGSVLLLAALGSFAASLRRTRRVRGWSLGYALLLVFLVSSVFTGAALAGALPGQ